MLLAEELYDIPNKQNIPIMDLEKAEIISAQMCKKLYHQGKFPLIRIGAKFFAPRKQVVHWLDEQLNSNSQAVQMYLHALEQWLEKFSINDMA